LIWSRIAFLYEVSDVILTILSLIGLFLVLPILILRVRDKVRDFRFKESKETKDAWNELWNSRLRSPQFDELDTVCGGLVPESLIRLFANKELVQQSNLEIHPHGPESDEDFWSIAWFVPMDREGQKGTFDLSMGLWGIGCCFASDGMGNFFWVPVTEERQPDAPVYFACHDPWGNTKVADSLTVFLSWPRVQKKRKR
jgi:hypothetical protein